MVSLLKKSAIFNMCNIWKIKNIEWNLILVNFLIVIKISEYDEYIYNMTNTDKTIWQN